MKYLPHKLFIGFIVIFMLGFGAGRFLSFQTTPQPHEVPELLFDKGNSPSEFLGFNFRNLVAVWRILQEKYAFPEKLAAGNMVDSAIEGFIKGINDPYTVYLNKADTEGFKQGLDSKLEGIGAELEMKDNLLTVVSTLKDTPAQKAGLLANDIIVKINGESTEDMSLLEAVSKIRGQKGTKVTLTIFRENAKSEVFDVTITRQEIEVESVTYEELPEGIGLISINQFSDDTASEFQRITNEILLKKPKGLVLDLRYNGGGYLDISVDIISGFIAGKEIAAKIKAKNPEDSETLYTHETGKLADLPLVVLVNSGSASASEIVAGAIQDHKRGLVFGEKSYGKGTVQEIEDLEDGASLRITIAEWLTPLGRSIDEVGITPDRIVEIPKDTPEGEDPQLSAAVQYLKTVRL